MNFWCHDLHFDDFKPLIARMHGSSSFPTPESSRINASRLILPPSPDTRRSKSGLLIFQVMKRHVCYDILTCTFRNEINAFKCLECSVCEFLLPFPYVMNDVYSVLLYVVISMLFVNLTPK